MNRPPCADALANRYMDWLEARLALALLQDKSKMASAKADQLVGTTVHDAGNPPASHVKG